MIKFQLHSSIRLNKTVHWHFCLTDGETTNEVNNPIPCVLTAQRPLILKVLKGLKDAMIED